MCGNTKSYFPLPILFLFFFGFFPCSSSLFLFFSLVLSLLPSQEELCLDPRPPFYSGCWCDHHLGCYCCSLFVPLSPSFSYNPPEVRVKIKF